MRKLFHILKLKLEKRLWNKNESTGQLKNPLIWAQRLQHL